MVSGLGPSEQGFMGPHSLHDQVMAPVIGPSRDGPADARRRASLPSPGVSGVSSRRPDRMLLHMHDWRRPVAEPEDICSLEAPGHTEDGRSTRGGSGRRWGRHTRRGGIPGR